MEFLVIAALSVIIILLVVSAVFLGILVFRRLPQSTEEREHSPVVVNVNTPHERPFYDEPRQLPENKAPTPAVVDQKADSVEQKLEPVSEPEPEPPKEPEPPPPPPRYPEPMLQKDPEDIATQPDEAANPNIVKCGACGKENSIFRDKCFNCGAPLKR